MPRLRRFPCAGRRAALRRRGTLCRCGWPADCCQRLARGVRSERRRGGARAETDRPPSGTPAAQLKASARARARASRATHGCRTHATRSARAVGGSGARAVGTRARGMSRACGGCDHAFRSISGPRRAQTTCARVPQAQRKARQVGRAHSAQAARGRVRCALLGQTRPGPKSAQTPITARARAQTPATAIDYRAIRRQDPPHPTDPAQPSGALGRARARAWGAGGRPPAVGAHKRAMRRSSGEARATNVVHNLVGATTTMRALDAHCVCCKCGRSRPPPARRAACRAAIRSCAARAGYSLLCAAHRTPTCARRPANGVPAARPAASHPPFRRPGTARANNNLSLRPVARSGTMMNNTT